MKWEPLRIEPAVIVHAAKRQRNVEFHASSELVLKRLQTGFKSIVCENMGSGFVTQFLIVFFLSLTTVTALTHRHLGPRANESDFTLRGRMTTAHPNNSEFANTKSTHVQILDISVKLKKDVILWDEVQADGIKITSCFQNVSRQVVNMELTGAQLDLSDYEKGSAIVIQAEDWTKYCRRVKLFPKVIPGDDVLFFLIEKVSKSPYDFRVQLELKNAFGSDVAPVVTVQFVGTGKSSSPSSERLVFEDNPSINYTSHFLNPSDSVFEEISLLTSSRQTVSQIHQNNIVPGAQIFTSAKLEGSINKFRFTRLFRLEAEWEQNIKADIKSRVMARSTFRASDTREIYRRMLPDVSFSTSIPFLGTLRLTSFMKLDFIQEVAMDSGLDAMITATNENILKVNANFQSGVVRADSLLPPSFGSSGSSVLDFGNVTRQELGLSGFFGYRPALSLELTLGSERAVGDAGAKMGLQAQVQYRNPPFPPDTVGGATFGNCNTCHKQRGSVSIIGKDLETRVIRNNVLESQRIVESSLFNIRTGTLCTLTEACTNLAPSSPPALPPLTMPRTQPPPIVSPHPQPSLFPLNPGNIIFQ